MWGTRVMPGSTGVAAPDLANELDCLSRTSLVLRSGCIRMKILINGLDYSAALDAVRPLGIERRLNEPSTCRFWLSIAGAGRAGAGLDGSSLAAPLRNQAVEVLGDDGTVYFTGYLAVSPLPEYVGLGMAGAVYRLEMQAVSDEILLDAELLPPSQGSTSVTAGALAAGLVRRTGSTALSTAGLSLATVVSHFVPVTGAKFSKLVGQVAQQARAAYRAASGALTLSQVGTVVHALNESDGTLALANLTLTAGVERALANDVTVCGADEPVAYVTEYFLGDGVTTEFALTEAPFVGPSTGDRILYELFNEAAIDERHWSYSGGEVFFSITGPGLTFAGGTGIDGQAALLWNDAVEAGGTLLIEAVGLNLSPGSTGTVNAIFDGAALAANCVAGYAVAAAEGTGVVTLQPLVQGSLAGAVFTLDPTHQYTLRTRMHCGEVQRMTQAYRVAGDSGLVEFGGGGVIASGLLQMEVQEFIDGVGGIPVTVYDGAAGFLPASYLVCAASSVNLIGTMRSMFVRSLGTGWVVTTPTGGGPQTRRLGTAADWGEVSLVSTGFVRFYTGYAPPEGEMLAVNYRSVGRAAGRAVNAASQAALLAAGEPATAVWTGSVTDPVARSSRDCRNAATALVTAASSVSAAWSGSYRTNSVALGIGADGSVDVFPGDALLLAAPSITFAGVSGVEVQVVVRTVALEYGGSAPDLVGYSIAFSNDWANDLSVRTSRTVPDDAWLPAAVSPAYLANLTALTVTAIGAGAVSVATNVAAATGGGFEVRRRDFAFQAGQDPDLVLRSAVGNFDIPRVTAADRFYVRAYDGNVPPNYSEFSVGLFLNLPLG